MIARTIKQEKSTNFFRDWISWSICVPTDKINSTRINQIEDYKQWVYEHILKAADLALRPKVVALFENVNKLLDKVKIKLPVQEDFF